MSSAFLDSQRDLASQWNKLSPSFEAGLDLGTKLLFLKIETPNILQNFRDFMKGIKVGVKHIISN